MDWTDVRIGSFVVLFLAVSLPADGQDVRVGVRAGPSVSSVHGETEDITMNGQLNLSPTLGPALSGFVEVQQGNWVLPRVDLTYVQKGTTVQGRVKLYCVIPCPNAYARIDDTYHFSYLEISTIGGGRLPISESWTPKIFVGQFLGVRLQSEGPDGESFEQMRKTTYGLLVGAAIEYTVDGENAIALDVRYHRALTFLSSEGDLEGLRIDGLTVGLEYAFLVR